VLTIAAELGSSTLVAALLRAGADTRQTTRNQRQTALHLATSEEVVRLLVEATTPLNARNSLDFTPLQEAVVRHWVEVVQALLSAGADPLFETSKASAWCLALDHGRADVIAAFVNHVDVNLPLVTSTGWTPLMQAGSEGQLEAIETLLEAGADVQAATAEGVTALHAALDTSEERPGDEVAGSVRLAAARRLLAAGADPEREDAQGRTPRSLAREFLDEELRA